jgi:hypothetical protein
MLVELGVMAAQPFEHHGGVLLFLVAVVRQDFLEFRVGGGVDALVVPIHRLQFLHQRGHGAVPVDGFRAQLAGAFVQGFASHFKYSCG